MKYKRSFKQIGKIMGIDEKTARQTFYKAMRKMRLAQMLYKKEMIQGFSADYSREHFTHDGEFIYRLGDGKLVDILKM